MPPSPGQPLYTGIVTLPGGIQSINTRSSDAANAGPRQPKQLCHRGIGVIPPVASGVHVSLRHAATPKGSLAPGRLVNGIARLEPGLDGHLAPELYQCCEEALSADVQL